jgi:hypothetical protein
MPRAKRAAEVPTDPLDAMLTRLQLTGIRDQWQTGPSRPATPSRWARSTTRWAPPLRLPVDGNLARLTKNRAGKRARTATRAIPAMRRAGDCRRSKLCREDAADGRKIALLRGFLASTVRAGIAFL